MRQGKEGYERKLEYFQERHNIHTYYCLATLLNGKNYLSNEGCKKADITTDLS